MRVPGNGFIKELNDAGTPNADMLLTCGMYISCTCCYIGPKIKHEFEQKVDEAIEKHKKYFEPHVKSMTRATTDIKIWNPSEARGARRDAPQESRALCSRALARAAGPDDARQLEHLDAVLRRHRVHGERLGAAAPRRHARV